MSPTTSTMTMELPESYPSFWEAIPVEPVRTAAAAGSAYTAFSNLAEDGRVLLAVEESDVGLR